MGLATGRTAKTLPRADGRLDRGRSSRHAPLRERQLRLFLATSVLLAPVFQCASPNPPNTPSLHHSVSIGRQLRPALHHSITPSLRFSIPPSPLAAKPAFPANYFHFCKSAFLGAKPLLPSLYKALFTVGNPLFRPAFCTHGGKAFFQIHALIVP